MARLRRTLLVLALAYVAQPPSTHATDLVTWGSGPAASIPSATRAELEAAAGITLLVENDHAFAAVTVVGSCYSWGQYCSRPDGSCDTSGWRTIDAPGSSSAVCAEALAQLAAERKRRHWPALRRRQPRARRNDPRRQAPKALPHA